MTGGRASQLVLYSFASASPTRLQVNLQWMKGTRDSAGTGFYLCSWVCLVLKPTALTRSVFSRWKWSRSYCTWGLSNNCHTQKFHRSLIKMGVVLWGIGGHGFRPSRCYQFSWPHWNPSGGSIDRKLTLVLMHWELVSPEHYGISRCSWDDPKCIWTSASLSAPEWTQKNWSQEIGSTRHTIVYERQVKLPCWGRCGEWSPQ